MKQAQKYVYLGSLIAQNGKCDEEIKRRIAMAKNSFVKLEHVLKNRKKRIRIKKANSILLRNTSLKCMDVKHGH